MEINIKHALKCIRSSIAINVTESKDLGSRARSVSGMDRHSLHLDKRGVGLQTRHLHLASAFLREMPYARVEKSCHEAPSAFLIARKIVEATGEKSDHESVLDFYKVHGKNIENWLKQKESVAEAA